MIILRKTFSNKEKPEKTGFLERLRSRKKSMDDPRKKRLRVMQNQDFQRQLAHQQAWTAHQQAVNASAIAAFGHPIV